MTEAVTLGPKALEQVRAVVRDFESRLNTRMRLQQRRVIGASGVSVVEGYLDGALAASSGSGTTATTATLSKWRVNTEGTWEDTGDNVTVTNRDDTLSGGISDFCIALKINGEWRPIWVECAS